MRKLKLFIINSVILTSSALLIRTIGIFYNVYISNKIGAEAVGLFQIVMSVYLFAITLASSGINLASNRIVAEELAKGNKNGAKIALNKCIKFSLILSVSTGILLCALANTIAKYIIHDKVDGMCFFIIALGLPFISMSSAINGYFSAVRRVVKTTISQIFEQLVKISATMYILTYIMPSGINFACLALVIGDVISEVCSFTMIYIMCKLDNKKYLNSNTKIIEKSNYNRRILGLALPLAITSYIRSGLSTIKQVLIPMRLEKSGLSCSQSLSKYGIINGMVLPVLLFPNVIITTFSSLLITEFTYYYTQKDFKNIRTYTIRILKLCSVFSVGILGIFLSFSSELSLAIYNNLESAYYFKILSPLVLLIYVDIIVDGILKGLNKQVAVMKCNIIDLVTSIICIYFLLPIFGVHGYVIVLYISETLNALISLIILIRAINIKFDLLNFCIKPLIGAYISRILTNIAFSNVIYKINDSTIKLIFSISIFLIIYTSYLFLTKCINKKDIKI